jgi:hypothetical protein
LGLSIFTSDDSNIGYATDLLKKAGYSPSCVKLDGGYLIYISPKEPKNDKLPDPNDFSSRFGQLTLTEQFVVAAASPLKFSLSRPTKGVPTPEMDLTVVSDYSKDPILNLPSKEEFARWRYCKDLDISMIFTYPMTVEAAYGSEQDQYFKGRNALARKLGRCEPYINEWGSGSCELTFYPDVVGLGLGKLRYTALKGLKNAPKKPVFPNDSSKLFPENYLGMKIIKDTPTKKIFEVQSGNETYQVVWEAEHSGAGHFAGDHYHVYRTTGSRNYRIFNKDPMTPTVAEPPNPYPKTFAPGDALPTDHTTR